MKSEICRKNFDYFEEDTIQIDCCTSSCYYIKTKEKYDSKDFKVYIDNKDNAQNWHCLFLCVGYGI